MGANLKEMVTGLHREASILNKNLTRLAKRINIEFILGQASQLQNPVDNIREHEDHMA